MAEQHRHPTHHRGSDEQAISSGRLHDQRYCFYNDGEKDGEDIHALVVEEKSGPDAGWLLDIYPLKGVSAGQVLYDVPRREKSDYGPEGGGRTWHI